MASGALGETRQGAGELVDALVAAQRKTARCAMMGPSVAASAPMWVVAQPVGAKRAPERREATVTLAGRATEMLEAGAVTEQLA